MIRTIRSVLAVPQAYQLFWNVIGGPARSRTLVGEYIRPRAADRILEIGCGDGRFSALICGRTSRTQRWNAG